MDFEFWFSPWVLGVLGLSVGSFLNVVAHRMPRMLERRWGLDGAYQLADAESLKRQGAKPEVAKRLAGEAEAWVHHVEAQPRYNLAQPGSACPACGHSLRWHENLPLLGWLRLKGKCSACGTRISARYPLIEGLTGLLFALVAWQVGPQPQALLWCGFVAVLLAASAIDWDTTLLPDDLTLPLLWAGLIAATLGWTIPLSSALWGAVGGYLSLWSVYWLFKLTTGKEGMGYGDFKLLAALGAWLGANMLLPIVLAASAIGAIVGIGMKLTGALREGRFVPFGPFLAGAGLAVFFAGQARVLGWLGWA
ncbi:MAG: prepilin peptidase [Burkholderiales bacterium]|uniref:prepilin peptidase n=1 Tax=Inhella sp. TaxID=1921806 RepID=UPI001AD5ACB0|nr:prepilin peptidase [Burkholderiales bacterium]